MFDFMLTGEQRALRDEVPRQLILDMDADQVRYPRQEEADNAAEKVYE